MGLRERRALAGSSTDNIGALSSMHLIDACCIAKAYVNAGIACGRQVRQLFPFHGSRVIHLYLMMLL
jgi:hypothetical protein